MGRRGVDVTQGRAVSGFIAPLLCLGGFERGGPDTAKRVTHGGSTTGKLPISRMLTIGTSGHKKTRPSQISSVSDRTVDGTIKVVEGQVRGLRKYFIHYFNLAGENFSRVGFMGYAQTRLNVYMHDFRIREVNGFCRVRILRGKGYQCDQRLS